jgi:hypothetical protein
VLVLVQWTSDAPEDWQELEHKQWTVLPDEPVHALNVQGVIFEGWDHYAVGSVTGGCTVTVWNDDPDGDPPQRWTFYDPAPDPSFDGRMNTRQQLDVFRDDDPLRETSTSMGKARKRRTFTPPAGARHGRWVSNLLHEQHQRVRSVRGWHEWVT